MTGVVEGWSAQLNSPILAIRGDSAQRKDRERAWCYLLYSCNVARNVFDRDGILHCESVTLTFYPCFVDQHTRVGRQT